MFEFTTFFACNCISPVFYHMILLYSHLNFCEFITLKKNIVIVINIFFDFKKHKIQRGNMVLQKPGRIKISDVIFENFIRDRKCSTSTGTLYLINITEICG